MGRHTRKSAAVGMLHSLRLRQASGGVQPLEHADDAQKSPLSPHRAPSGARNRALTIGTLIAVAAVYGTSFAISGHWLPFAPSASHPPTASAASHRLRRASSTGTPATTSTASSGSDAGA